MSIAYWVDIKGTDLRQPPSHIIFVLIIPNRVSEALGLTRNNSECLFMARISPRTDGKVTKKRAQNKRNLNFFFMPSRSNFGESQIYKKLREKQIFLRVNYLRPPPFGVETGCGNLSLQEILREKTFRKGFLVHSA